MKPAFCFIAVGFILLAMGSCATVPHEPPAPGEVRLLSMSLSDPIRANIQHTVKVAFEAGGEPEIKRACFYFAGDGPYCSRVRDVTYGASGSFTFNFRPIIRGSHRLECYAEYVRNGKTWPTNTIGTQVMVVY